MPRIADGIIVYSIIVHFIYKAQSGYTLHMRHDLTRHLIDCENTNAMTNSVRRAPITSVLYPVAVTRDADGGA